MAAVPALERHVALLPPANGRRRNLAVRQRAGTEEVEWLRRLAAGITSWRCARLDAGSRDSGAPPAPAVALGAFARAFAAWLEDHPARANEPLEWLVPDALTELFG